MVSPISSTVVDIRNKVRRLTASPSTLQLTDEDLDEYINTAYSQDMPADIKSNLFREVVEVYVKPNIDRYALSGTLSANTGPDTYESIREPVYVEGRRAQFYKDRGQFYGDWPKIAALNTSLTGDGATTVFNLVLGGPILQNELVIGVDIGGVYTNFKDNGDPGGSGTGIIFDESDAAQTLQGTVVYATGTIALTLISAPSNAATLSVWYYPYSAGRPYGVLWWNNELIVRPVPDRGYKIELEAYRYPTQFTGTADTPTLKQWWQYIALLAAVKVLQDRQDMEGIANLEPLVMRQEMLVRNRIANEQIGMRNVTIYSGSSDSSQFPFNYWAY